MSQAAIGLLAFLFDAFKLCLTTGSLLVVLFVCR